MARVLLEGVSDLVLDELANMLGNIHNEKPLHLSDRSIRGTGWGLVARVDDMWRDEPTWTPRAKRRQGTPRKRKKAYALLTVACLVPDEDAILIRIAYSDKVAKAAKGEYCD